MGAKTCFIAQSEGDVAHELRHAARLDEAATADWVAGLYPDRVFAPPQHADLSHTFVRDGSVVAGCFPGLRIVVSDEVALDRPSELPAKYVQAQGRTVLHAMHSVVDWCAFAVWQDGRLQRAFSVAPDSGVIEDIGARLPFEQPYWDGAHPAVSPEEAAAGESYPLPFHPLELGEAALRAFFGFQLEGYVDPKLLEPERVAMLRFDRPARTSVRKPWWKLW